MRHIVSLCPKCGVDMTAMSDDEGASHARFHELMAKAPKSIPSQDVRPNPDCNWRDRSREETRQQFLGWGNL